MQSSKYSNLHVHELNPRILRHSGVLTVAYRVSSNRNNALTTTTTTTIEVTAHEARWMRLYANAIQAQTSQSTRLHVGGDRVQHHVEEDVLLLRDISGSRPLRCCEGMGQRLEAAAHISCSVTLDIALSESSSYPLSIVPVSASCTSPSSASSVVLALSRLSGSCRSASCSGMEKALCMYVHRLEHTRELCNSGLRRHTSNSLFDMYR